MLATICKDKIRIDGHEHLPNGVHVLTVKVTGWEDVQNLPKVIAYAPVSWGPEIHFGFTGWNSDSLVAYYRCDAPIAKIIK